MSSTVLIGLDGATFTVLDPLIAEGVMPCLGSLMNRGSRAELRSVVPALTPPAWTSLLTGRGPGRHGVFDFFRKESAKSHHIRLQTSADISADTIMRIANRRGRRATVLNFPLMFPAPRIEGVVIPGGWMPWRQLRLGCHPAGLYDELKSLPGFNPRELAMDMTHEEKALEGCRRDEYEGWIDLHIRRERQWGDVTCHLMRTRPADLTAILFDGVDKLQHLCWRFLDPASSGTLVTEWEQRVRDRCREYFRQLDHLIAEIVELAGAEATIVIASDHGFGPQTRTFFANGWLHQRGYLAWADGAGPAQSDRAVLGMGQLARHVYTLDWNGTKAYVPLPSGNGIHIVRRDQHGHGVAPAEYEPFREQLIRELYDVRDPESNEPVVARVWRREEIFAGPNLDIAPDLTLELTDGGLVSILASDVAVAPRAEVTGTHRPDGVFVAAGPEIRQGARLDRLSILDVPSFVLHSLGVAVPADLEGRVPTEAIDPDALRQRPVQRDEEVGAATAAPVEALTEEGRDTAPLDSAAEEEIFKRLQALGYVE